MAKQDREPKRWDSLGAGPEVEQYQFEMVFGGEVLRLIDAMIAELPSNLFEAQDTLDDRRGKVVIQGLNVMKTARGRKLSISSPDGGLPEIVRLWREEA